MHPTAADALPATPLLPGPRPYPGTPRLSLRNVGLVAAAHALALYALVALDILPLPPAVATLMVQVLPPAPPAQTDEPVPQPRPQPRTETRRAATPTPRPVLAAPADSAASSETAVVREASPTPPVPAAPAISQPRFDADYLSNPAPNYPSLSRRMGEEGKVVLRVFVEANGRPAQIELRTTSGFARLDNAAQEAVWRWKFVPARRGDDAVAAWVLVPIVFNLRN